MLMARMETVFSDAVRRHLYAETQDFVQLVLRDPLRKAIKNKKDMVRVIIMSVRETCADWMRGTEPADDPALKGKKDPEAGYDLKVPRRNVGEFKRARNGDENTIIQLEYFSTIPRIRAFIDAAVHGQDNAGVACCRQKWSQKNFEKRH